MGSVARLGRWLLGWCRMGRRRGMALVESDVDPQREDDRHPSSPWWDRFDFAVAGVLGRYKNERVREQRRPRPVDRHALRGTIRHFQRPDSGGAGDHPRDSHPEFGTDPAISPASDRIASQDRYLNDGYGAPTTI